jgi:hypothetical protein
LLKWSTTAGGAWLTGGRFGLEPGMVDMDGVALAFVLTWPQTVG